MKKLKISGVNHIAGQMAKNLNTSIRQGKRTHTQEVFLIMISTGARLSEAIKFVESGGLVDIYNK